MKTILYPVVIIVSFIVFQSCNSQKKSNKAEEKKIDNSVVSASFSPDGKKILVARKNSVVLYDATSATRLKDFPEKTEEEEFIKELFRDEPTGKTK